MSDSVDQVQTQLMVATGTMLVLGLVMQIAYFVVALTVVRRASRAASGLLATSAAISIVAAIVHPIVSVFVSRLGGAEEILRANTLLLVVFGLIGLANASMQLVGIIRLAGDKGPREDEPSP